GAEHAVEARPLDIEDFTAQRQDRLVLARAPALGGAAGRVTLDDEQFGLRRVLLLAIGQLARQRTHGERAFAGDVARLARRLARRCRLDDLVDHDLAFARVLFQPGAERLVDEAFDHRADFRGNQLVLGLRGKFRIGNFY